MPVTARGDRRKALLVVGVLAMLLGVRLIGTGVSSPDYLRQEGADASSVAARSVLPETTASPVPVDDHISIAPACPQTHSDRSRSDPPGLTGINGDPRGYLSAMAAWRTRRPGEEVIMSDPYQASLNPAVYLIGQEEPRHEAARQEVGRLGGIVCFPSVPEGDELACRSVRGR